ncbi:FAD-dependent oxidoreductase [Nonomuraea sp. NPDC050663]|uniref:FAD-dependent oxidoreductase n=1 Tax=Nonomuraea sp. NPDC050663 TaxID=3364370 RepID=UPI0037B1D844
MRMRWDVIVVGAGPGGLACAIAAADAGSRVLVLEQAADIGGALPYSGGHLSAGGFSAQRERGIEDDPERHYADIVRINRGTGREDLTRLSLAEQPAVLEWLAGGGFVADPGTPRIVYGHEPYTTPRTVHATETPGGPAVLAALRRLLEPHVARGRVRVLCGTAVAELLVEDDSDGGAPTGGGGPLDDGPLGGGPLDGDPLGGGSPEGDSLGKGSLGCGVPGDGPLDGALVDGGSLGGGSLGGGSLGGGSPRGGSLGGGPLDGGPLRPDPLRPDPLRPDLPGGGPLGGSVDGDALAGGPADGGIVVRGVITADGRRWEAAAVVLATGGFGFNADLFAELEGAPLTTSAAPTSTGSGLLMARRIGAGLQGTGRYLPTFGGLPPESDDDPRVDWIHRPHLVAQERPPWEIYVDRHGRRWVAEDEPSIDRKERALMKLERMTFWMIFDARALRESPPMVHGWSPQELDAACGHRRGVHRAGTLEELASLAGISGVGLAEQVRRYNAAVREGVDEDFGRTHLPAVIGEAPFYAIENRPVTLITFAGVDVDERLRVRRADGRVIPGLYAVGEVIGSAAVNGNAFCSGMCLTPAMAFGRLVGRSLGSGGGEIDGSAASAASLTSAASVPSAAFVAETEPGRAESGR